MQSRQDGICISDGGKHMLDSSKIIGFAPTKDATAARTFYVDQLGLTFVSEDEYALVLNANGNMVRIIKARDFKPVQYTVLGWEVQNLAAVAAKLKDQGVVFEQYPFIQDKQLGIWTAPNGDKIAWFKDPDGNVLSISQHV
jgi:catechol 2,3-dioxygenase-like lactoylglutathione lyase family enzyme